MSEAVSSHEANFCGSETAGTDFCIENCSETWARSRKLTSKMTVPSNRSAGGRYKHGSVNSQQRVIKLFMLLSIIFHEHIIYLSIQAEKHV